ncbi:GTP-binding protein [Rufibacter roseus]|uniref:GTP-binding protein n=1 Tax=Rufibacter roseus TaxID=1567108 RepID=A0ABW2DLN0_9BACT|nr:GTP-binding protein [Rufibacter roseus]
MKLFLIGGFLGSGKTTAIQQACMQMIRKGQKVGVITNDQGEQLVDSAFLRGSNVPTLEVTNGCFCCNYEQFENHVQTVKALHQADYIFAESVGSCTDLIATIVKPLAHFYPEIETLVTVFADARVLPTLTQLSRLFADSVSYIYKKQLEEADVLVLSKVDLISEKQLLELKQLVASRYPDKIVLYQNSLDSDSVQSWVNILMDIEPEKNRTTLELDYDTYGAGEALLAWLDQELEIIDSNNDATSVAYTLINGIYKEIKEQALPVGHLKFLLDDGVQPEKISFTAVTEPDFARAGHHTKTKKIYVLINARLQTGPDQLEALVNDAIRKLQVETGIQVLVKKKSSFQPGYPVPTHRYESTMVG